MTAASVSPQRGRDGWDLSPQETAVPLQLTHFSEDFAVEVNAVYARVGAGTANTRRK